MLSRQSFKLVLLISVFIPLLLADCHAEPEKRKLTLAILPCYDPVTTFKKFDRLAAYLRDQTGHDMEISVPTDLERVRSALQNGEIDLILQDPHTYVQLAGLLDRDSILLALAWDGGDSQRGLVIARKDSGLKEVRDLQGKSFMFGPKLSISKWIATRELFNENGIDIGRDLKAYSHGGCCEDIAFHVFLKSVDAGAVCDDFFEEHAEDKTELGIDFEQLVIIGRTGPFPTRIFAARRGIGGELAGRVRKALLALNRENPEHAKILGSAKVAGFRLSADQDYDGVRALMGESGP